jgi:Flp pilus assembly protein TadD
VHLNQAQHDEAVHEFQQVLQLSAGANAELELDLGFAYAKADKLAEAQQVLAKISEAPRARNCPAGSIAIL